MTPEEQQEKIDKLKAEHQEMLDSTEQATALPQAAPPADFGSSQPPANARPAVDLGSLKQTHNSILGDIGSSQPPPVLRAPGQSGSGEASATRVPIAASDSTRTLSGGSSVPQERTEQGSWTRETARSLDLSDAMNIGANSQDPDEVSSLGGATQAAGNYMQKINRILQTMQALLIENATQIEELQSRFNRLR